MNNGAKQLAPSRRAAFVALSKKQKPHVLFFAERKDRGMYAS